MKFLIDQQLPIALRAFLEESGFEARHVSDLNLDQAPDQAIADHLFICP